MQFVALLQICIDVICTQKASQTIPLFSLASTEHCAQTQSNYRWSKTVFQCTNRKRTQKTLFLPLLWVLHCILLAHTCLLELFQPFSSLRSVLHIANKYGNSWVSFESAANYKGSLFWFPVARPFISRGRKLRVFWTGFLTGFGRPRCASLRFHFFWRPPARPYGFPNHLRGSIYVLCAVRLVLWRLLESSLSFAFCFSEPTTRLINLASRGTF